MNSLVFQDEGKRDDEYRFGRDQQAKPAGRKRLRSQGNRNVVARNRKRSAPEEKHLIGRRPAPGPRTQEQRDRHRARSRKANHVEKEWIDSQDEESGPDRYQRPNNDRRECGPYPLLRATKAHALPIVPA